MREIKFRAWDEENNEYIHDFNYEGYDISDNEGSVYISKQIEGNGTTPILEMEQYTGLKDKNGKEIFEGDVDEKGFHVVWRKELAAFELWDGGRYYICLTPFTADSIEIVGTIHELEGIIEHI